MKAIFLSYRTEDTEGQASRLFDDLTMPFGDDAVFMDVADVEPGQDFRRVIDEHVASCGVLLPAIGKYWLHIKDAPGRRRLDDPADLISFQDNLTYKMPAPIISRMIPITIAMLQHATPAIPVPLFSGDAFESPITLITNPRMEKGMFSQLNEPRHGKKATTAPMTAAIPQTSPSNCM